MLHLLPVQIKPPPFPLALNVVQDGGFEDPKHPHWDGKSPVVNGGNTTMQPWGESSPYIGAHAGKRAWDFWAGLAYDFYSVTARLRQDFAPVPVKALKAATVWAKANAVGSKGVAVPTKVLTIRAFYTEGEPTVFKTKPPKEYAKVDFMPSLDPKRSLSGIEFSAEGAKGEGTYVAIDDVAILRPFKLPGKA